MSRKSDECTIREVRLKGDLLPPLIANFEHGTLKEKEAAKLCCGVFKCPERPQDVVVGAVSEDGDVLYQGVQDRKNEDLCHTFIAVRNKRTNKIRLIEAANILLSPTVGVEDAKTLAVREYPEAMANLSRVFGSKRSKRMVDQRERMTVDVDSVKDKFSNTILDVSVDLKDTVAGKDNSLDKLLPPCNRDAGSPEGVYSISGILSDEELKELQKVASHIEKGKAQLDIQSQFYKELRAAVPSGDKEKYFLALILYAEMLLQFCNMHPKLVEKKNYCSLSQTISMRILRDFTVAKGSARSRPSSMLDKAIIYILILALHVGDFQCNIESIAQSVTFVDVKRIKILASMAGAVPHGTLKSHVVLKVPLPPVRSMLPVMRRGRKK